MSEAKSERKPPPHAVPSSWHGCGTAGFQQDPDDRATTTRGWNWIVGPDGKPLTVDGTPTHIKDERNSNETPDESLSNGDAAMAAREEHPIKAEPIPSAAVGIASVESIPSSSSSSSSAAASKKPFQNANNPATTETVPSAAGIISPKPEPKPPPLCDAPDCAGKRKRESSPQRGWAWLLAPDGSFSTVEPTKRSRKKQRCEASVAIPPTSLPSRRSSAGLDCAESNGEDEDEEWSVASERNHGDDNVDNEIRFDIDKDEGYTSWRSRWGAKYRLLVEYKNKHGTTRVPRLDRTLGAWVKQQRIDYKRGKLSRYRQQCLNSLGFKWTLRNPNSWMAMYNELCSYKKEHNGSVRVPCKSAKLGRWVTHQRYRYKQGTLSQEQINLLESIGFEWQLVDKIPWATMYNRLVAYRKKYKTTRVPPGFKTDPRLGNWVKKQRNSCKAKDRVDLLDAIGFEWKPYEGDWMNNYNRLVAYKKKHGNTRVPTRWKTDPQLADWVSTQRKYCKAKDRIDLLNAIDFDWKPLEH